MRHPTDDHELSHAELLAMKAAGNCWVEDERGEFWWPFCTVEGCPNRACLRLNSVKCYPHTLPGVPRPGDELTLAEKPLATT